MKIRLLSILCILLMSLSIEAQTEEFETAAEAVKNMKVGVNLGNTLESVSGELNNMWIEANTERRCMGQSCHQGRIDEDVAKSRL